jgi:hypothetical protein
LTFLTYRPNLKLESVTDNFRVARQNEAAGAADATAWVTPAAVAVHTFL